MIVAPVSYDKQDQDQHRADVDRRMKRLFSREEDIELQQGQRLILRSPDGSQWEIEVSNLGVVSAVAV